MVPSTENVLSVFQLSHWALEPDETTFARHGWSNEDMDPVPPRLRTWTACNYVTYWLSTGINIGVWQLGSSILALGLSWCQALICLTTGYSIISVVMLLNGRIGARLHVTFPVLARSSFGFWFSYFAVFSRIMLSIFAIGFHVYNGGQCVYQMLKAIWPSIATLPNHLPPNASITNSGLLCYFLYWLIQFPFILLSPHQVKRLFLVKSIIAPLTWLGMVIWALVQSPGSRGILSRHATISGTQFSWTWLSAMNSVLGSYSSLSVNIPDFARYAKNERSQYINPLVIPLAFTLSSFVGIVATSAGVQLYGEVLWNPLFLIDKWESRPAAFFAAFAFGLVTLGAVLSLTSMSIGNDMMALFPKYINIRRGQVICTFIGGWAVCPWKTMASAQGLLTFLNGYTIFLGPFAAIIITDFWLVHRGCVDVPAMYDPRGRYRYTGGFNWRAMAAILVTALPTMPGLIHSINPSVNVGAASRLFDIAWMYSFVVASFVYYTTSVLFPARETYVEKLISADDAYGHSGNVNDLELHSPTENGKADTVEKTPVHDIRV
ncbi:hypothetical protein BS17DRAFT_717783 [Gyrodon lividus]|nr:hypothetical protein BS17DRAFT_717783 [Gyrodon lividus]